MPHVDEKIWNKPLIEQGKPALENLRKRFRAEHGLRVYALIAEAREIEAATPAAKMQARAEALLKQRDAEPVGSIRWIEIGGQYHTLQQMLTQGGIAGAEGEAAKVWTSPRAATAVRNDLQDLRDFLRAEMERILDVLSETSRANGWGNPGRGELAASSPAFAVIEEFLARHLESALANTTTTGDRMNVSGATYILLGAGWRTAVLPPKKSWLDALADAILPAAPTPEVASATR